MPRRVAQAPFAMSRVYLSSTYQGLDEYRRAAREAIRRLDHEPVGMEDYSATEKPQISLESAMRKPRKVVPITRGERNNTQVRSKLTGPVQEKIRILTCRQTSATMTFHL